MVLGWWNKEQGVQEMPEDKTENTAKEKAASRRATWRAQTTVRLTEKGSKNPKKAGTASFDRYQGYLGFGKAIGPKGKGVSVADLMKAGVRMDDIRHDFAHEHITLEQPFELRGEPAAAEAAQ